MTTWLISHLKCKLTLENNTQHLISLPNCLKAQDKFLGQPIKSGAEQFHVS